jgi:hypothetical protein
MIIADSQDFAGCMADDRNRLARERKRCAENDEARSIVETDRASYHLVVVILSSRRYDPHTTRRGGTSYPSGPTP